MIAQPYSKQPPADVPCDPPADAIAAATHADPYPYYRRLAAERLYRDEALSMWVAASAAAVTAVLASGICRVRPPTEPVPRALLGSPAADIFRHLVRMNDGEAHCPFKRAIVTTLDGIDAARLAAVTREECERLARDISPLSAPDRLTRFIFMLPVRAMARLLGVPADCLNDVSRWTHAFAVAITPLADPNQIAAGKEAAGNLLRLFHRLLGQSGAADEGLLQRLAGEAKQRGCDSTDVIVANGIGFLSQTYEATAALAGNALLVLAHDRMLAERVEATPALVESLVAEVARYHSPTQSTRRFVAQDGVVAGQPMRKGDVILVLLAAASQDGVANARAAVFDIDRPDRHPFTFGTALHACPGSTVATLIAEIAVGYLLQAGLDLARLPAFLSYRRSAHLRIPVFGSDLGFDASVAIPKFAWS